MPILRRRAMQRREDPDELTENQRTELLNGVGYLAVGDPGFAGDVDRFIAAWREHGPALLAEFIAKCPGGRPFAWWVIDHFGESPDLETHKGDFARRKWMTYVFPVFQEWRRWNDPNAYLLERGLLTEAERVALAARKVKFDRVTAGHANA